MTSLSQLWRRRFSTFLLEMGKYGRLIFNDHFSIILVIMLGFGLMFYRDQLLALQGADIDTVKPWIILIASLILTGLAGMGRPIWLMQEPDKSYLFAQGNQWRQYWMKGCWTGLLIPLLINIAISILVYPFLSIAVGGGRYLLLGLILIQILSVIVHHLNWLVSIYFSQNLLSYLRIIIHFLGLMLGLLFSNLASLIGLGFIFVLILIGQAIVWNRNKQTWFDFEAALQVDLGRQATYYRILSFFVDVPQTSTSVKRREFLDPFLRQVEKLFPSRDAYLLLRLLFRHKAYSGVWLRVLVFFSVLFSIEMSGYLRIGLGLIAFYLTLVQLLPMSTYYQDHPLNNLYPQDDHHDQAIRQIGGLIIGIQAIVLSLITLVVEGANQMIAITILTWLVGIGVMIGPYTSFWLNKQK